jgi:hypothetical protein
VVVGVVVVVVVCNVVIGMLFLLSVRG